MGFCFERGPFYGEAQFGMNGAAFDIRAQVATGCEGDVQVHTHHDAHFVLVLSGRFISSARGARDSASAPTLIFNPPGTTHRDRFLKGVGTFVTLSMASRTAAPFQFDRGGNCR
jgi:AraC family transcriptional regulator